jgi:hypothetical protein
MKLAMFIVTALFTCGFLEAKEISKDVYETGQNLHEHCKVRVHSLGQAETLGDYCLGYVIAHFEALFYEFEFLTLTESPSPTQLVAVVNKYLDEHEEMWAMPASRLVRNAFLKAFPAKRISDEH